MSRTRVVLSLWLLCSTPWVAAQAAPARTCTATLAEAARLRARARSAPPGERGPLLIQALCQVRSEAVMDLCQDQMKALLALDDELVPALLAACQQPDTAAAQDACLQESAQRIPRFREEPGWLRARLDLARREGRHAEGLALLTSYCARRAQLRPGERCLVDEMKERAEALAEGAAPAELAATRAALAKLQHSAHPEDAALLRRLEQSLRVKQDDAVVNLLPGRTPLEKLKLLVPHCQQTACNPALKQLREDALALLRAGSEEELAAGLDLLEDLARAAPTPHQQELDEARLRLLERALAMHEEAPLAGLALYQRHCQGAPGHTPIRGCAAAPLVTALRQRLLAQRSFLDVRLPGPGALVLRGLRPPRAEQRHALPLQTQDGDEAPAGLARALPLDPGDYQVHTEGAGPAQRLTLALLPGRALALPAPTPLRRGVAGAFLGLGIVAAGAGVAGVLLNGAQLCADAPFCPQRLNTDELGYSLVGAGAVMLVGATTALLVDATRRRRWQRGLPVSDAAAERAAR